MRAGSGTGGTLRPLTCISGLAISHNGGSEAPAVAPNGRPKEEQIRAQLERVLKSPLFRSSHRCQVLLRHVAERALAGEAASLKEHTLGIDVFGRAPDYDTNSDPVVRGTAGEIRKKLAQYYQDPEHAGELRIDLIPMWDRYLAMGDVSCLLQLASIFEKRGKPYRIRSEAATSFSDLRERPSVLIGAFDNEWTLRAVGEMRYTFYKDFQGLELIHDRDQPENTGWKLVNSWPQWNIANDYAIVSRVFDVHTDRMVVVAAGITHFGTAGAGDFLSNPQHFSEVVPRLPRDWHHKNLQIVLRVPVIRGVAGHPQVLATHVW